jgi:hypothetical protein
LKETPLITKPIFTALATLAVLGIVISNATVADELCIAHPLAPICDNPPTLPDERQEQPAIPVGLIFTPSITANSTATFASARLG